MISHRTRLRATPVLFAVAVAGCGSGGGTKTVVQTVAAPAQTQAAPATTTPSQPAPTTTPTATTPAAAAAPVAGLPSGAVAIQGRYQTKVIKFVNTKRVDPGEALTGDTRLWVAKMTCSSGRCQVALRRELKDGGFDTATLTQNGSDPRSYSGTETTSTRYCFQGLKPQGPSTTRVAIRASGVVPITGQPTAKRLDGYFTAKQTCGGSPGRGTAMFRGALAPAQ